MGPPQARSAPDPTGLSRPGSSLAGPTTVPTTPPTTPLSDRSPRAVPPQLVALLTSDPPHTGKLATVRADGRPHVAPIWFALDQSTAGADSPLGDIIFNTGADTLKGKALRRDPRVALCVDDERPPFSFASLEGPVSISESLDDVVHWATVIGGRYMGQDRAEEYGRRNGVPGELLVRLRPTHIASAADLAD